jgi:hypothetical protein
MTTATFPALIQQFFTDRLCTQMNASPNTIASYRDTFRLLLRFASEQSGRAPTQLKIEDVDCAIIGDFLAHVETRRRNSARSRNARLAAIRSFFRFVAMSEPAYLLHCQRILAMPSKRYVRRTVEFLDRVEMDALLAARRAGSIHVGRASRPCHPHRGSSNRPEGIGDRQSAPLRYRARHGSPRAVRGQGAQAAGDAATTGNAQGSGGLAQGTGWRRRRSALPDRQRDHTQPRCA